MNIERATVTLDEKELRELIFSLKHELEDTLKNHIKNLQDTYNIGSSFRQETFLKQNEYKLNLLKNLDIWNYNLHGDVIYQMNQLYPMKDEDSKNGK